MSRTSTTVSRRSPNVIKFKPNVYPKGIFFVWCVTNFEPCEIEIASEGRFGCLVYFKRLCFVVSWHLPLPHGYIPYVVCRRYRRQKAIDQSHVSSFLSSHLIFETLILSYWKVQPRFCFRCCCRCLASWLNFRLSFESQSGYQMRLPFEYFVNTHTFIFRRDKQKDLLTSYKVSWKQHVSFAEHSNRASRFLGRALATWALVDVPTGVGSGLFFKLLINSM